MGGLAKKLLATTVEQSLEPIAGAVDFDGANDYLIRNGDFLGNIDSKTFTFSVWIFRSPAKSGGDILCNEGSRFSVRCTPKEGLK